MKHYCGIGLYNGPENIDRESFGYVMDDFGNLVSINLFQFEQNIYIRTGKIS